MIDCTTVDTGGGRVVRVGEYRIDNGDGEPPERRVFLSAGWASVPSMPFAEQTVDVPLSALPAIVAALEAVRVAS